jgi:intein-encoded DNA endonuclease-like protein
MKHGPYSSRSWVIPTAILRSPDPMKKEFLRCFFDDEGSIFRLSKRKQCLVRGYSINKKGIMQIAEMLRILGVKSKIYGGFGMDRNVFGIEIPDVKLFRDKVGFLCERKKAKLEDYTATMP